MTRGTNEATSLPRVVWIGIGLLVVAGLALHANALAVHRRADRADGLARAVSQQAADTETATDAAHQDLDQAVSEAVDAAQALDAVRAQLIAAGTSEASIVGDVDAARTAMAALQTQIDASATGVQTRTAQLAALRSCLDVGQRAVNAAALRPGADIDAQLAAASTACAATAGVGP